jgi:hypothetical protein
MRSGSGFPAGVHWVMELYLDRTRHTRLLVLVVVLPDSCSRELSGRIRMATVELTTMRDEEGEECNWN